MPGKHANIQGLMQTRRHTCMRTYIDACPRRAEHAYRLENHLCPRMDGPGAPRKLPEEWWAPRKHRRDGGHVILTGTRRRASDRKPPRILFQTCTPLHRNRIHPSCMLLPVAPVLAPRWTHANANKEFALDGSHTNAKPVRASWFAWGDRSASGRTKII